MADWNSESAIKEREAFLKGLEAKTKAASEGNLKNNGCDGSNVLPQTNYRDRTCYCGGVRACPNREWSPEKANGQLPYCKIRKHGI